MSAPGLAGGAAAAPGKDAIVWRNRRISYGELDSRVNRAARALQELGVDHDVPVAVALRNRPEWIEVALATARLGARMVPLSWRSTPDEIDYLVRDSGAVLTVGERDAGVGGVAPALHVGDEYERALDDQTDAPIPGAPAPDAVSTRMYTSGTTGRPKAIVRPRAATREDGAARAGSGVSATGFLEFWGLAGADEVNLTCTPLHHAAGYGYALGALACMQTVVLMERFDPAALLSLVEQQDVTYMNMVPTQFVRIAALDPETRARHRLTSLRRVLHGSAPCPVAAKQAMFDLFGPVIWETYGGTEGLATIASPEDWLERPGTVGRAVTQFGVDVSIHDDDGNPLPPGEPGLVYIRPPGPQRFEYEGAPESTASAWRDDRFTLGDIGYLDDEGYLFLLDRKKDVIVTGGVNVYPAEVERVLAEHPDVSEVAVIGVPDDEWGESVLAVVVAARPVTADELIAHCRGLLNSYKCPRAIDFVDELDVDPLGKVRKRELRDRYWRNAERRI